MKCLTQTIEGCSSHLTIVRSLWPWAWRKYNVYAMPTKNLLFQAKQDPYLLTSFHVYTAETELRLQIIPTSLTETNCTVTNHSGNVLGIFTRDDAYSTQWLIQDKTENKLGHVQVMPSPIFFPEYQIGFGSDKNCHLRKHPRFFQVEIDVKYSATYKQERKLLLISAALLILGQRGRDHTATG